MSSSKRDTQPLPIIDMATLLETMYETDGAQVVFSFVEGPMLWTPGGNKRPIHPRIAQVVESDERFEHMPAMMADGTRRYRVKTTGPRAPHTLENAFKLMSKLDWDGRQINALRDGHFIHFLGDPDNALRVYASVFQREQDALIGTPFSMRSHVRLDTWPEFLEDVLKGILEVRQQPSPNVL